MNIVRKIGAAMLALVMLCSLFAVAAPSALAISGGGSAGTGSILAWGCDMSYYNTLGSSNFGLVDFAKMKADGCDFVILRIGYEGLSSGLRNRDTSFVQLYNMARAAGMKIGVYYYTCRMTYADAAADAQWCIDIMQENNMYFEYPIYYDVEYPGDEDTGRKSHEDLTAAETTSLCLGWAETLANAGYFPGVYGGIFLLGDLQASYTDHYDTWIAFVRDMTIGAQYNPASSCTPVSVANPNNLNFSWNFGAWQYKWYNQYGTQVYDGATWKDSNGWYPLDCNVAFKDYPTIMETYGYNNMVTKHKIEFETNGGSAVDPVYVKDGDPLTAPTPPSKYAFNFAGWYCNPELTDPYDFSSPVPYGFTLYAKWEEAYWGAQTNLMPNSQQLQLNDFNGQGAIWPYFNDDAYGSVTFYNGVTNDDNWSWPSAYMTYEHSFDSVGDTYMYVKKDGTALFNVVLTYLDKDGVAHDLYLSDVANLTGTTDFPAGPLEEFYNVGSYIRNLGHAPASGNIKFTKVTYFVIGAKDSYVRLYDLKFTPLFAIEDPHKSIMNQNVTQLSGVGDYVYDDGTLTMNAKAADGYSIKMNVNEVIDPSNKVNLLMDVTSTAPFNVSVELTNGNSMANMEFKNEFFNNFNLETVPEALPAGEWNVDMNLAGYYEWNGGLIDSSTIKSVTVTLAGEGTLTMKALQASSRETITYVRDGGYSYGSFGSEDSYVLGDVNGDNAVTTADARLAMVHALGGAKLTGKALAAADYNNDGDITTMDARLMMLKALTS